MFQHLSKLVAKMIMIIKSCTFKFLAVSTLFKIENAVDSHPVFDIRRFLSPAHSEQPLNVSPERQTRIPHTAGGSEAVLSEQRLISSSVHG